MFILTESKMRIVCFLPQMMSREGIREREGGGKDPFELCYVMKAAAKSHKEEGPFKVKSPPDDPQRKSFSRTKPK
jgi:hypothetical protein